MLATTLKKYVISYLEHSCLEWWSIHHRNNIYPFHNLDHYIYMLFEALHLLAHKLSTKKTMFELRRYKIGRWSLVVVGGTFFVLSIFFFPNPIPETPLEMINMNTGLNKVRPIFVLKPKKKFLFMSLLIGGFECVCHSNYSITPHVRFSKETYKYSPSYFKINTTILP